MWRGWNEIAFLAGYFELASVLIKGNCLFNAIEKNLMNVALWPTLSISPRKSLII